MASNLTLVPGATLVCDETLNATYITVAEGILLLAEQAEAKGGTDSTDRAHVLMMALSFLIKDRGILDAMVHCVEVFN